MIRKYSSLIILLSLICFGIFVFSHITQAAQSGKGWYKNSISVGTACQADEFEAEIKIFTTENSLLSADNIQINATVWQDTTGDGKRDKADSFYNNSFAGLQTVTVCISAKGSSNDLMVLTVTVSKSGYKTLWSYQRGRFSGSELAGRKWTREIYLALSTEPVNLAHRFPINNYIISNSKEVSFEIDVLLRSGSGNISDLILGVYNETTEESFQEFFIPPQEMINQGTIIFPSREYPDGRYVWHVWLMEDNNGYLYPNLGYDQFIIDTIPPEIHGASVSNVSSQEITFFGRAQDNISGLRKIEHYLDNNLVAACFYTGTVHAQHCEKTVGFDPPLAEGTYTWKVLAEDMGGLQSAVEMPVFIGEQARLRVQRQVWSDREEYIHMQLKFKHLSGYGAGNEYETSYEIVSDNDIEIEMEIPSRMDEHETSPQFWTFNQASPMVEFKGCDANSCRFTVFVAKGADKLLSVRYSDQIHIEAIIKGVAYADGIPIKLIEGELADFQGGDIIGDTVVRKSSSISVNAILEAPLKSPALGFGEVIFDEWQFWQWLCDPDLVKEKNRCRIIADPYQHKRFVIFYKLGTNKLEVRSYVDRVEIEGAEIEWDSGTTGTGGKTRYLFEADDVINTTLRAPEYHGGKAFSNWEGCDSHSVPNRTCTIEVRDKYLKRIAANYGVGSVDPSEEYTLVVNMTGAADDSVSVNPPDIEHSATEGSFSYTYPDGLYIELEAIPGPDSSFVWGGACSGEATNMCVLTMDGNKTVTIDFTTVVTTYDLTIDSTAGGSVTTPGEGTFTYDAGIVVDLEATPEGGYNFVNWTGDTGTIADVNSTTTTITMNGDYSITAEFVPFPTVDLKVNGSDGPITIVHNTPATLSWTSTDAVSCTASGDWSGNRATDGLESTGNLTSASTYELTCIGPGGGSASDSVTVNVSTDIPPTAAMGCNILHCNNGPGCVCGAGLWEMFIGTNYEINNLSSEGDNGISTSSWSVIGRTGYDKTFSGIQDYGSVTISLLPQEPDYGDNVIKLEVIDTIGLSDTATRTIRVKRDAQADFECSLIGVGPDWHNCAGFVVEQDQVVYFKGEEGTTLSRSSWHTGAPQIMNWQWEKGVTVGGIFVPDGPPFGDSSTASTTLTADTKEIRLTIRDNHPGGGRTAQEKHTLNVKMPLPEYREVRPRSQLDNFLARITGIFR